MTRCLFVCPQKPWVISYLRSEMPGVWLNTSFHALTNTVTVLGQGVKLAEIYKKMKFA